MVIFSKTEALGAGRFASVSVEVTDSYDTPHVTMQITRQALRHRGEAFKLSQVGVMKIGRMTQQALRRLSILVAVMNKMQKAIGEFGPNVTFRQASKYRIHRYQLKLTFGSWNEIRKFYGLGPNTESTWTKDFIDTMLQECVQTYGPNVSVQRFKDETGCNSQAIKRHYGTWNNMRTAHGLPTLKKGRKKEDE